MVAFTTLDSLSGALPTGVHGAEVGAAGCDLCRSTRGPRSNRRVGHLATKSTDE
jgi:hypothetical protein